jgi:hypothetical protein
MDEKTERSLVVDSIRANLKNLQDRGEQITSITEDILGTAPLWDLRSIERKLQSLARNPIA